jgi:hypothetical protein
MSKLWTSGYKCQDYTQVVININIFIQVVKNVNMLYKRLKMSIFHTGG